MNSANPFERLAEQARRGDQAARAQLVRELAPSLARMMKRAAAPDGPPDPLLQRLQAVARRLADAEPDLPAAESMGQRLGRYIAGQFCPAVTEVRGGTVA